MAVTRINNNQISDASAGNAYVGINAAVKLQNYSITATKIANNLTYGSDLTVTGNLTVQGNTTTIDTTYTTIEDPIILLASNQTGSPTVDIGFVGQRGTSQNIAFVWDESAGQFITAYTTTGESNTVISIASYADLHVGNANIGGNIVINGTTSFVGSIIGNVSLAGNVTLGNVLTNGQVSAAGNVTGGNVLTGGLISSTGNITSAANIAGGNLLATTTVSAVSLLGSTVSVSANITGGNLLTGGLVSSTGNITSAANVSGGNLLTGGQVSSTGNITSAANISGGNVLATTTVSAVSLLGSTVSASANITGGNLLTGGLISSTGNITSAANVSGGNVLATTLVSAATVYGSVISASANVTGGNILTAGLVSATGNITSSANVTGGNVLTSGIVSASGNVSGGNLTTTGTVAGKDVSASGNVYVTGFISATGNLYVANVISQGNLTVEDPLLYLTANTPYPYNYDIGFFSQFQTSPGTPSQANGYQHTGWVRDQTDSTWKAFSNVLPEPGVTIDFTNAIYDAILTGAISAVGNITSTANVSAGNLLITTTASAASFIGSVVSVTANITGGNVLTGGLISSTGNITSAANVQGANVIATSNVVTTGVVASGNISGGNILTVGLISSTGNITSAANVAGGNVIATSNVVGAGASISGNISGGNILTGGLISSTGNITSAANVAGGNLVATSNVVTTGVSASGNVTGGNILTGGLISSTGNITSAANVAGGNILATAIVSGASFLGTLVSMSGNITGANLNTGGANGLTLNASTINSNASRIVVNSNSSAIDFAVNGTTANVFYVNGTTNTVSIGSSIQTTNAILAMNATNSFLMPVGNTVQRPGTGVTGMLRFNSTLNAVEVYDNSQWSTVGSPSFTVISDQQFAGDGANVNFTLTGNATTTNSTIVSINGVVQVPTIAYSITGAGGNILTFTEAPQTGDLIDVRVLTTTTTVTSISNSPGNAVVATNPTINEVSITGNLVPTSNVIQSLGSSTLRWKDLYVGGNSIYLGNVVMKNVAGGNTIGFYGPDGTTPATIASTSIDTTQIANGTSSVAVSGSGGNVTVSVGGTSNVAVFDPTGLSITGNLTVTGNATLTGNILGDRVQNGTTSFDIQTASGNANLTIGSTSNVVVWSTAGQYTTGLISATGNITTGGQLQSSAFSGGNISWSANNQTDFGGNIKVGTNVIKSGGGATSITLNNNGANINILGVTGATAAANTTSGALIVTGGVGIGGDVYTGGIISSTGNITSSANVAGGNILATTTVSAASYIGTTVSVSGTITGATLVATGTISTAGNIVSTAANATANIGSATTYFNTVHAKATSAQYADLAEVYASDKKYEPGTVLSFGGEREVTLSTVASDARIAGVVSTNPSYIMNAILESEYTATVALTGRVPTKVSGPVAKGDMMVSGGNGRAIACATPAFGTVIGKALENHTGGDGIIEVVVGRL